MSPRLWRFRVQDILEAIARIREYTEEISLEFFMADTKTQDAVIRNFIVIGEAANAVPANVRDAYPGVPWRLMADMRNFAVHEYWGVEWPTVWETIKSDLPPLIPRLKTILEQFE